MKLETLKNVFMKTFHSEVGVETKKVNYFICSYFK